MRQQVRRRGSELGHKRKLRVDVLVMSCLPFNVRSAVRLSAKPHGPVFGKKPAQLVFTGEFAPFAGSQVLDEKAPLAAPDHHTRQEAATSIFEYIEIYYNRQRMHSALNYQTPEDFDATFSLTSSEPEINCL